jgi:hypothetical protein
LVISPKSYSCFMLFYPKTEWADDPTSLWNSSGLSCSSPECRDPRWLRSTCWGLKLSVGLLKLQGPERCTHNLLGHGVWVIMDKTWLSNAFQNHVYFRIRSKYTDKYSDQVFSTHERHDFKKAKNNNMSHMRFIRYLWFITQGFRAISGLTDCWRSLADERWRSRGKNVESLLAAYEVLTEDAEEVKGRRHFLEGIWW